MPIPIFFSLSTKQWYGHSVRHIPAYGMSIPFQGPFQKTKHYLITKESKSGCQLIIIIPGFRCSIQRRSGNRRKSMSQTLPKTLNSVTDFIFKKARRCFLLQAASRWLRIVPWGIRKLARHLKDKYGNPPMIITENGE